MSKIRLLFVYLSILTTTASQGCTAKTDEKKPAIKPVSIPESGSYKAIDITFKKDKMYEIAYLTIKEGQEKALSEEYFPKAFPIAAEYGVKKIATFAVTEVTGGTISPKVVMYFEWPSMEAYKNAVSDKRLKKLFPIRDNALAVFERAYYKVGDDVTVTFREDKVYEIMAAWLNPNSEENLKKYFEVSEPMKQRIGKPVFKTNFSTVQNPPSESIVPHMAGIIEWGVTQDYKDLMADKEFQEKAAPLMQSVIDKLSMVHAKFVFD